MLEGRADREVSFAGWVSLASCHPAGSSAWSSASRFCRPGRTEPRPSEGPICWNRQKGEKRVDRQQFASLLHEWLYLSMSQYVSRWG